MSTEVKLPESQLQDDAGAGPKPTESHPKSTDAIRQLSMSFEESGLSGLVHAESWQKANELVAKENAMYPVPGTQNNQAFFCGKCKWRAIKTKLRCYQTKRWCHMRLR